MSFTVVKFIIIDNEQTSELCIEKRCLLFNHEETFLPDYCVVSRENERLILYDSTLHLITPHHYVVKIYSAEFSEEKSLFENNALSIKNFMLRKDAVFTLQSALVRIDSNMYRAFITARPNSLFRYVENDEIMYEKIL